MKTKLPVIVLTGMLLASLALIGCSAFKSGAPPSAVEQQLYTVQTNLVQTPAGPRTNYQYANGPGIQDAKEVGTVVGNLFGVGGLVGTAIGGLGSLWGWFRSSKWKGTGASLAQSIETMREFVKQLPNGAVYDDALTSWLMQHQQDTAT